MIAKIKSKGCFHLIMMLFFFFKHLLAFILTSAVLLHVFIQVAYVNTPEWLAVVLLVSSLQLANPKQRVCLFDWEKFNTANAGPANA